MNALAQTEDMRYTAAEFHAMTDLKGRWELLEGELIAMSPSPTVRHQKISKRIVGRIDQFILANNGSCEVFDAPLDVDLDGETTVQPDIFVVCDTSKLDENRCNGAPDWVIEILSPSDPDRDTRKKLYLYSKAGVKEYWIVDPMDEQVIVYPFAFSKGTGIYSFDDDIPVELYKDAPEPLSICINKVLK